eukprot:g22.t1
MTDKDPYAALFSECAGTNGAIDFSDQWREFARKGLERGLFEQADMQRLSIVWQTVSTQANAFGRKGESAGMKFEQFQRLLCHEFLPQTKTILDMLNELPVQCHHAIKSATKEEALDRIFSIQNSFDSLRRSMDCVSVENLDNLKRAGLFWNQIYDKSRETKLVDYQRFQEENAALISQQTSFLRAAPALINAAMKSRSRVVDRVGLCLDLDSYGAVKFVVVSAEEISSEESTRKSRKRVDSKKKVNRSESDNSRTRKMCVVLVPVGGKSGRGRGKKSDSTTLLSPTALSELLIVQSAHQQLSLSAHFVDAYGVVRNGLSGSYWGLQYEYARAKSLPEILSERGTFSEESALFRFWSSQILRALVDLRTQSSFGLRETIAARNVAVAMPGGERVLMTHIPWGADFRDADSDIDERRRDRDLLLVCSFGTILRQMLGISSFPPILCGRSDDEPNAIFEEGDSSKITSPVLHVTSASLREGVEVFEGESFVLNASSFVSGALLDAAVWQLSCDGETEHSSGLPVLRIANDGFGDRIISWKASKSSPTICALQSGSATLVLRLYLRSDVGKTTSVSVRSIAEYRIKCNVRRSSISDTMKAILRACAPSSGRHATLSELRRHPYFQQLPSRPGFEHIFDGASEDLLYELSECLRRRDVEAT